MSYCTYACTLICCLSILPFSSSSFSFPLVLFFFSPSSSPKGPGAHCIVGIQILYELVQEMNTLESTRTLAKHRKTAGSFRDESLYSIFTLSTTLLRQVNISDEQQVSPGGRGYVVVGVVTLIVSNRSLYFVQFYMYVWCHLEL